MSRQPHIEMAQLKLVKSVFAVNVDHPPVDERVSLAVTLKNNGEFFDGGRRAHFLQSFKTSEQMDAPFFMDVEFGALFFLDPPPLPLERTHYVKQVLAQVVFPYMREYVAETTRRGGFTPLILSQSLFDEETLRDQPDKMPGDDNKWLH